MSRSHRSVRYQHAPRPRQLSDALPPMNVSGEPSPTEVKRLEEAYETSQKLAEKVRSAPSFEVFLIWGNILASKC
jgi:hypothetical protein